MPLALFVLKIERCRIVAHECAPKYCPTWECPQPLYDLMRNDFAVDDHVYEYDYYYQACP